MVGRALLVSIFLLSGLAKLGDSQPHVELLTKSYEKWHGWVEKNTGVNVPVKPELVTANADLIIKATGVWLVIGAILSLLDIPAGRSLLVWFLLGCNLVIHFPPMYEGAEQEANIAHFMKNLAIMGGLYYIGTGGKKTEETARPVSTGRQGRAKKD